MTKWADRGPMDTTTSHPVNLSRLFEQRSLHADHIEAAVRHINAVSHGKGPLAYPDFAYAFTAFVQVYDLRAGLGTPQQAIQFAYEGLSYLGSLPQTRFGEEAGYLVAHELCRSLGFNSMLTDEDTTVYCTPFASDHSE